MLLSLLRATIAFLMNTVIYNKRGGCFVGLLGAETGDFKDILLSFMCHTLFKRIYHRVIVNFVIRLFLHPQKRV